MSDRQDIAVIGEEAMVLGFRLAGVKEYSEIADCDQAKFDSELAKMMSSTTLSIIIADEGMLSNIGQSLKRRVASQTAPLVVGVPSKDGAMETGGELRALLKRALGIEIKAEGDVQGMNPG